MIRSQITKHFKTILIVDILINPFFTNNCGSLAVIKFEKIYQTQVLLCQFRTLFLEVKTFLELIWHFIFD